MSDQLEKAEQYQRLFVKPMIDALETKLETMLQPVLDDHKKLRGEVDGLSTRTSALEGSQKKALAGWGVFATALAGVMSYAWTWIKGHLRLG